MNQRLKALRKRLGLTQQEFSNRLGIKRNTVATYEAGKSNPSDAAVLLICREFNVNENWLRTGEGGDKNMFHPNSNSALDQLKNEYQLTDDALVMIEQFVKLKPETQHGIINYIIKVSDALSFDCSM